MIRLINEKTNTSPGVFDTKDLADDYLKSQGITDTSDYNLYERIDIMNYISRICYVDGDCIYNNKGFWVNTASSIYSDYENHVVLDFLGESVSSSQFKNEMNNNSMRLTNIYTRADEVACNIKIGNEFIAIFREECLTEGLGGITGSEVAIKASNIIPLLLTGSFYEATQVLKSLTTDTFFTTERIEKYVKMLNSADVITYST